MITIETVVAMALRHPLVMDQLGEALRSDIVTANPFYRRIVEFADDFMLKRRKLPSDGDWEVWIGALDAGMIRDGSREALGRLLMVDTGAYDPDFFASTVIADLQQVAAQIARARLNELPTLDPKALIAVAQKVESIRGTGLQGLAHLSDLDTWMRPVREEEQVGTGFPTLNHLIGGWGKELWILFADSGVGKSILLQNFASNAAVRAKNVLHVTLELGLRSQIHRYYRQVAEASRAEFNNNTSQVRSRLEHWFRLAHGQVCLIEFAAYSLDTNQLRRVVDRAARVMGRVDLLILDYLDLMSPTKSSSRGGAYEDLGRTTHEVRSLCPEFDLTTLTASQSVRRPERAGRLTMRDMGDSYNKVRGADGLVSLVQTPEEEEVHQGRLGLLKVRDSGGRGQEIGVYINRELALIQELNHPNTIRLMHKLGHLPAQQALPQGGIVVGS